MFKQLKKHQTVLLAMYCYLCMHVILTLNKFCSVIKLISSLDLIVRFFFFVINLLTTPTLYIQTNPIHFLQFESYI